MYICIPLTDLRLWHVGARAAAANSLPLFLFDMTGGGRRVRMRTDGRTDGDGGQIEASRSPGRNGDEFVNLGTSCLLQLGDDHKWRFRPITNSPLRKEEEGRTSCDNTPDARRDS